MAVVSYRQRAVELWGRLDIVVNNAYPTGGHPTLELWGEATDIEEEAWDVGFDIGDLPAAAAGMLESVHHSDTHRPASTTLIGI